MGFRSDCQLVISPLTVSADITEARERAGMTQAQLGRMMKISYGVVRQHERGITLPDLRSLQKYSDAFGVELVIRPKKGRI